MSRAAADAWIAQHEDTLANRVVARKDALDSVRWPQVLRTHTLGNIPADGVGTFPDNLNAVTSDNGDGWEKLNLTIGGKWDAALEMNNYGDSIGNGLEYVAYVFEGSLLYRKCFKVEGHQQNRLHDWVEIIPLEKPTLLARVWNGLKRMVGMA